MSGLFSSLYTSTNALRAHSAALDIIGRNMANVNNPAYARQRIVYGDKGSVDTPLGSQSLGVEPVAIQQMRDRLIDNQVREEAANTELLNSQVTYLRQAQTAIGQGLFGAAGDVDTIGSNPELPAGISASIDAFFNAWQSFATKPSDSVNKQQLIANTDDLINKIQLADRRLADIALPAPAVGNTITGQMDEGARQVNGILTTLSELNRQIGRVEIVNPGTAVDLRDQRQAKLEELGKYIDYTTVQQTSGQIGISVSDGLGGTVALLDLSVVNGTLARNGSNYEWTPTTGPVQAVAFAAGSLAGYQQVGATVQGYRDQLDDFVNALVTQVNDAYDNSGANANGDFFNGANLTAGTISRTATAANVVATATGGPSGANDRALAVAAVARDTGFFNGTPSQSFTRIVTQVGQDVSNTEARYDDQKALGDLLLTQRDSYGGVSLDEEAADMMRLQRAYQSSAKMMAVLDELLSEVINTLAR
ncbi:MAG: flagellar hook-associated protein FlgK [Opitutaceae bacterium]|nr:flagellar hook-associated protein FlgK [Opitutaceae bacterium]